MDGQGGRRRGGGRSAGLATACLAGALLAATCGCADGGSGPAPPAAPVLYGPMLGLGSPTGATVLWTTPDTAAGAVRLRREDGTLVAVFTEAVPARDHAVELQGLSPGTTYTYRLLSDGAEAAGPFRLRTFPAPASGAIRFVAFGDSRTPSQGQEAVAARIRELDPIIAIHTGDLVPTGAAEEYGPIFFDPYREFLPETYFYPSLGNHELYADGGDAYFRTFALPSGAPGDAERYYSFDAGPCHFVALDTNGPIEPGTTQSDWLDGDLSATDRPWKVVFFHHPPYGTSTVHDPDPRVRDSIVPILDRHRVDLVLCGHNHNYERMYPLRAGEVVGADQDPDYVDVDGTIYVVTGGGGAPLYAQNPDLPAERTALFAARHHLVEVAIDGDLLTLRAIAEDGEVFDAVTCRKG